MTAPQVNEVGDLVLNDPQAMRALAEPGRLDLLDRLRRDGPASALELAAETAEFEELERYGLTTRADGRWETVGKGFVFEIPDDPEGQGAAVPSGARLASILAYFLPEARG